MSKTKEQLLASAEEIRTNTAPNSNTADLVGSTLKDMINKSSDDKDELQNNIDELSEGSSEAISSVRSDLSSEVARAKAAENAAAAAVTAEETRAKAAESALNTSLTGVKSDMNTLSLVNDGVKYAGLVGTDDDTNKYAANAVPTDKRKVGLIITYLDQDGNPQTYQFTGSNISLWSTNISYWQGVDDVPTIGSDNLVKSGGVYNAIQNLEYNLGCRNTIYENTIQDSNSWKTIFVNLLTGNTYCVTVANSQPKQTEFRIESSDGQIVGSVFANEDISNGKTFFFTPQSDITKLYIKDQTNDGYPWNVLVELYTTTKEGFSAIISNFTDNYILNRYIKELYIVGTTIENLTIDVYATDARQVVLRKNGTAIANKYFSQDADGYGGVLEVPQFNGSGVKAYIIIDWDNISRRSYTGNVKDAALKIDSNNLIKEYLAIKSGIQTNTDEINNIKNEIDSYRKFATIQKEDSNYWKAIHIDLEKGEKYKIVITNSLIKPTAFNITARNSTQNTVIATIPANADLTNGYDIYFELDFDATTIYITDQTNDGAVWIVDFYVQNQFTKSLTNHFYGKRLLAIGDSVTAAGEWQKKVGELLNMEIRTHAKGGIGIIEMVDGDGSGNPPTDVDPDDYGTTNLYALTAADVADVDAIVIHGFYNAHNLAYLNLGTKTDMYPTNNTFIGQLNYAIKKIFNCLSEANNSMCKVYISAPHKFGKYQWNDRSAYDDGDIMLNGVKLCSEYNSVYLIDCMNGAGINKYNWNVLQNSPTPYNPNYLPSDGVNDGTNKPFASLNDAPAASENNGKIITILGDEGELGRVTRCYISNGTDWQESTTYSTPWNADQLHPSSLGYEMLGCFIAKQIMQ